jgi:anti-sigma regulatory factor (Ser/Thr protein kinase)
MPNRVDNRIVFGASYYITDLPAALACLHAVWKAGYEDVILDFGNCTAALPAPVLAFCARVLKMRLEKFDFTLRLPNDQKLARHFQNANWAYLFDPAKYSPSNVKGSTIFPATQFFDTEGQQHAVNSIIDGILSATKNISRQGFAAFEWSVNEITDNVLVHSQSEVGGIVQMSTFTRRTQRIEYVVVDAGIGIPKSLRRAHPELRSDAEALNQAVKEGVTRDKTLGQGNGLYGSYRVCSEGEGIFHLQSGHAKLVFTRGKGLQVATEKIPFEGTLIDAQVNFSDPRLLSEALKFGGKVHVPSDFVESRYEILDAEEVRFVILKEAPSFRSRLGGTPVRYKLHNLATMCPGQKIVIDFADVPLVSSSFADEVFGKLFLEMGPISFSQRFEFLNLPILVRQLIDRAISQRLSVN